MRPTAGLAFSLEKKKPGAAKRNNNFSLARYNHTFLLRKERGKAAIGIDECNSRTPLYGLVCPVKLMFEKIELPVLSRRLLPTEKKAVIVRLNRVFKEKPEKVGVSATAEELLAAQEGSTLHLLKTFFEERRIPVIPVLTREISAKHARALKAFEPHAAFHGSRRYNEAYSALQRVLREKSIFALNQTEKHGLKHVFFDIPF